MVDIQSPTAEIRRGKKKKERKRKKPQGKNIMSASGLCDSVVVVLDQDADEEDTPLSSSSGLTEQAGRLHVIFTDGNRYISWTIG